MCGGHYHTNVIAGKGRGFGTFANALGLCYSVPFCFHPGRETAVPSQKPAHAVVQVAIRIKEGERRQLAAAAKRNHTSFNAEIAARIMRYSDQEQLLDIKHLHEGLGRGLAPLLDSVHELSKAGDLLLSNDELVSLLKRQLAGEAVPAEEIGLAIGKAENTKRMMEIESGRRLRRMRTI
jgi:hypothetical protein